MKPDYIRRAIGGASALLGLCWLWVILYPILRHLWMDGGRATDWLLLIFFPLAVFPGTLAVIFGIRLFRTVSVSALRWVVGLLALAATFQISLTLHKVFPQLLPERVASIGFLFVGSLIAIAAYPATLRFFLRHSGIVAQESSALISRGALTLLAWQLWLLLCGIFDAYSPIKEGYKYVHPEPWEFLSVIVPIVVAYGTYKLAVRLIPSTNPGQADAGDQDSVSA